MCKSCGCCFMEPPLLTLVFLVFGFLISVYALHVESHLQDRSRSHPLISPPPPSPPPPPPPPPSPPPPSPSPPPPPAPSGSPPPPSPLRTPTPLEPPPAPSSSTQLNSRNQSNRSPPPLGHKNNKNHKRAPPSPPPRHENKINAGKKIGLLFSGIAAILQIGVISFLIFKRRQILKVNNRYETCS